MEQHYDALVVWAIGSLVTFYFVSTAARGATDLPKSLWLDVFIAALCVLAWPLALTGITWAGTMGKRKKGPWR